MQRPCKMRSAVNVVRSGATASSAVGIERRDRLIRMPSRRLMCWLNRETASPATAIPIVLELTAKPMAAGVTLYARARDGRIAWVANRSTTVRKAVKPITIVRSSTPEGDSAFPSEPLPKVLRAPFRNPQFGGRSDVTSLLNGSRFLRHTRFEQRRILHHIL